MNAGLIMDDEKENLCIISKDDLGEPASIMLTPSERKRSRENGKCNMRKSLAWNTAFFTEEGVLDPLELSRLSGSIINTGGKSLCELNVGGLSPLTELNHCSSHLKSQHFVSKSSTTQQVKLERKLLDATQSRLRPIFEEEKLHSVPVKMTLPKGSSKKPPQAPTAYSQKRVTHVAPTNPTTTIPKVMPKAKLTVTAGNFQQKVTSLGGVSSNPIELGRSLSDRTSTSIRGVSSNLKEFGRSLSACSSKQDSVKRKFQNDDKALQRLKISSSTSAAKLLESNVGHSSCDMPPAVTQNRNHTGVSAPVLTKPTALRMPSPSLGFFSQGKAPASHNDPSHPNLKPTISTLPSRKSARLGSSKLLSTSNWQKPVVRPTVTTARPEYATYKSMPQSSVASRSKLSLHGAETAAVSKMEMEMSEGVISRTIPQSSVASRSKLSVHGSEIAAKSKMEMKSEGVILESIPEPLVARHSNLSVHDAEIAAKSNLETKDTNGADGLLSACYSSPCELGRRSSFLATPDFDRYKEVHGQRNLLQINEGSSSEERRLTKQIPTQIAPHNSSQSRPSRGSGYCFLQTEISKTAEGNCIPKTCSKQQKDCSLVEGPGNAPGAEDANVMGSSTTLPTPRTVQEYSPMQVSHIKPDDTVAHNTAPGTCCGAREDVDMEVRPTASDGNEHQDCKVIDMKPAEARGEKEEGSHTINKAMSLQNVKAKPDALALKCQISAAPFSNEWLAALEAFGEDILQLKTGPVQNSPTDKAPQAPGPWSPVKRKAQDIGPFDCTKYSKNNSSMDRQ